MPCPSPADLPNPGIKLEALILQVHSLPAEPPGKPQRTKSISQGKIWSQSAPWQAESLKEGLPWWPNSQESILQETWVRSLVRELRSTCLRATKPMCRNWRVHVTQQKIPHDARKILCATTKTRLSQLFKKKIAEAEINFSLKK